MNLINEQVLEKVIFLTWRNPLFMAITIALVWLVPQLMIRRIMDNNYKKSKQIKQKKKIDSLYPKSNNIKT